MSERGVAVVAVGARAVQTGLRCLRRLDRWGYAGLVVTDSPEAFDGWPTRPPAATTWGARADKLALFAQPPFAQTLYLDADTEPRADPAPLFAPLADGWDMALCPSHWQGVDVLQHVERVDREVTLAEVGTNEPLQLQAGVVAYRDCPAVREFGLAWGEEWARYGHHDQGAFLRALMRVPLRIWIMGWGFNGGAVIAHHWGQARGR